MLGNGDGYGGREPVGGLERQWEHLPDRYLPGYVDITDYVPEELIEIHNNKQLIDWTIQVRHELEQKAAAARTNAAINIAGLYMYAENRLEELVQRQPNERLARKAQEIGQIVLDRLFVELKTNSNIVVADTQRVLQPPLVRDPRPYTPRRQQRQTFKHKFVRWLLDE